MGGTYVGGNVKGIDGTFGIAEGNILVSFKAHDLTDGNLIKRIGHEMRQFQQLDPADIQGTARNGDTFIPLRGPVAGRIKIFAVPQSQASYIISPQFIEELQQLAEETKVIPIVRVVRNWSGRQR